MENEETVRTLTTLRDDLYEGSWHTMREDLQLKSKARPYNHRIQQRFHSDLEIIGELERKARQ